ncbi:hypothetical protein HZB94_03285 [Candidatus Falkowbacteria bacterium]|nr:hypothetical protein [Candidatus Falkowbacteria bacterium]
MVEFYKEKVSTYLFIIWLTSLACIILLIALLSQFTNHAVPLILGTKIIMFILILFVTGALFSFKALNISVNETQLIFGFGVFSKRIYLKNIEKIEIADYKFTNYWGYGIRFGFDGSIGYIPRAGRGIKIFVKDKRWPYFIISAKPDELKQMIEKHR